MIAEFPQPTPAQRYLEQHLREAGRTELRAISPRGVIAAGIFDSPARLQAAIDRYSREANLYCTIQALAAGDAINRIKRTRQAIRNDDIDRFIRLVFDIDVIEKPAGPDQLEQAREVAIAIRRYLSRFNFPLPALVSSGNGYHLIYRCAPMPNSPEVRELLRQVYAGLDREFSCDAISFDTTVQNPGRIIRLPGSLNLKSDPGRPVEIELPERWRQVQRRDIETLAHMLTPPTPSCDTTASTGSAALANQPRNSGAWIEQTDCGAVIRTSPTYGGSGDYASLDIVAWFRAHGHYIRPLEGNKHAVLCPWASEHSSASPPGGGDSIIFEADHSWPGFYCHHDHCRGRGIGELLESWGDADQFCAREFQPGGA